MAARIENCEESFGRIKGETHANNGIKNTTKKKNGSYPIRKIRRLLRIAAYNVLLLAAGLALSALAGEVYLRLTRPLIRHSFPSHFVPGVGILLKPNVEVRYTNNIDFFSISHTNSLGFLDREPIGPERAAASCHIAMIGDSFVEAREVPIADKFHVRLEELAARHLPHLDITTSAYGQSGTGQINQLPYYDAFARRLSPKLVVLVFIQNDFTDNARMREAFVSAKKSDDGTFELLPPVPYSTLSKKLEGLLAKLSEWSYVASEIRWLLWKWKSPERATRDGYALDVLSFALDQFAERTERDGVSLVILAIYAMGTRGHSRFDSLAALADARGIPVISQLDYILRQGGEKREARWAHDYHWNAQGHQWAAEALLEYLEKNPEVCAGPKRKKTP